MPLVIQCPKCSKRYQVADSAAGKQVRCQQCQSAFVAAPAATAPAAPPPTDFRNPLAARDPLAGIDLSQLPAAPAAGQVPAGTFRGTNPLGTSFGSPGGFAPAAATGVSNPLGGPTDAMMRIVCGAMLAGGIVLIGGSMAMFAATGSFYIAVVALAPLALILGVAGLISPNVIRAVGKYGGHLSWHYKAIGYAVLGLYFVILILLLAGLMLSGFEPERPGRPRGENRPSNAYYAAVEQTRMQRPDSWCEVDPKNWDSRVEASADEASSRSL